MQENSTLNKFRIRKYLENNKISVRITMYAFNRWGSQQYRTVEDVYFDGIDVVRGTFDDSTSTTIDYSHIIYGQMQEPIVMYPTSVQVQLVQTGQCLHL